MQNQMNSHPSPWEAWLHGNLDTLIFSPKARLNPVCQFPGISLVFRVSHESVFAKQFKESAQRKQVCRWLRFPGRSRTSADIIDGLCHQALLECIFSVTAKSEVTATFRWLLTHDL